MVSTKDPTVFINADRVEQNAVQLLFDKCDLIAEGVPLSFMQLALYNSMVTDSKELWSGKSKNLFELDENEELLPQKPYPEYKLVDDLLWQLDQQRIKITIHGVTQEILLHQDSKQIEISVPLPEEIVVSEDPINLESPKSTEVSNYIGGVKVTFRTSSNSSEMKTIEDEQKVDITIWTPKRLFSDNIVNTILVFKDKQNIKISLKIKMFYDVNIYIHHKKVAQTRLIYIRGAGSQGYQLMN